MDSFTINLVWNLRNFIRAKAGKKTVWTVEPVWQNLQIKQTTSIDMIDVMAILTEDVAMSAINTRELNQVEKRDLLSAWLDLLSEHILSLKFGTVVITVHNSQIVQVEKNEKLRLDISRSSLRPQLQRSEAEKVPPSIK